MSVPVDLADLAEQIKAFGPVAYLVTTGEDARPHVVSVAVEWDGDDLAAGAGNRTSTNAEAHPAVSLLWPGAPGADYSLIVDGQGRVDRAQERIFVRPSRAVLHRVAGANASLPSCVTVL